MGTLAADGTPLDPPSAPSYAGLTPDTVLVFERWADDDIPVILDGEIQRITGSESQALSDRLRDHRLALAAHRGGRHGVR